jgi:hypothetical protein
MTFENELAQGRFTKVVVFDSQYNMKNLIAIVGPIKDRQFINSIFEKTILGMTYN